MENGTNNNKIILSEDIQKNIFKFFLKTSIPRKAKQEIANKNLPEENGIDIE